MIPDETVAYALAAWKRFDDTVTDELLRAVSGAFVLVAACDGELSESEASRFLETLGSKSDVLSPLDFDDLSRTFHDLSDAMISDPDDGRRLALECVARVKTSPHLGELVWGAAKIAASADGRVEFVEEKVMGDIRKALGLPFRKQSR
jgi:tellurite resistance protein